MDSTKTYNWYINVCILDEEKDLKEWKCISHSEYKCTLSEIKEHAKTTINEYLATNTPKNEDRDYLDKITLNYISNVSEHLLQYIDLDNYNDGFGKGDFQGEGWYDWRGYMELELPRYANTWEYDHNGYKVRVINLDDPWLNKEATIKVYKEYVYNYKNNEGLIELSGATIKELDPNLEFIRGYLEPRQLLFILLYSNGDEVLLNTINSYMNKTSLKSYISCRLEDFFDERKEGRKEKYETLCEELLTGVKTREDFRNERIKTSVKKLYQLIVSIIIVLLVIIGVLWLLFYLLNKDEVKTIS